MLWDWVKWFPFYKVCLPFLNLSDSSDFSNGNLASCVLTEIALPTHLESKKMYGLRRTGWSVHNARELWITFSSYLCHAFVKIRRADNAKETDPKCQNKQFQLTRCVTYDGQPFHNISMASRQSGIEWWRHVEYLPKPIWNTSGGIKNHVKTRYISYSHHTRKQLTTAYVCKLKKQANINWNMYYIQLSNESKQQMVVLVYSIPPTWRAHSSVRYA